jgi:phospholipid/cholesterol/gamma-HCH transport system substrate-binding protein
MENKSHALMAGIFTVVLGIALGIVAMWLGRDNTVRSQYQLVTRSSVSGLSPQADVRYRGLDVGKVEDIRFDPEVPGQILVDIGVTQGTPITESTFAQLGYQGVTGLAYVQLDDKGTNSKLLATSDGKPARLAIQPGLLDKLSDTGSDMVAELDTTVKLLNQLLAPENKKILMHTVTSIDTAASQLGQIGPELTPTLNRLPHVLDTAQQSIGNINRLAADADSLALRVQEKNGTLDRIATSVDEIGATAASVNGSTIPRVDDLAEDARRSARALTRTANVLAARPQSVLFGNDGTLPPGPGESGFTFPAAAPGAH